MDNKNLSDFMPKANTEGEMVYGDISTSSAIEVETNSIIEKLAQIKDPELGINIYDLGLIYDVKKDEFNNVKILMTLTTVNCPVADSFPLEVAKKTSEIEGIGQVAVKLTFDPSWNKDMMSEDARLARILILNMTAPLFTLSQNAEKQISNLLSKQENSIGLKIGLNTKGCAGLSYTMEYANNDNIQGYELVDGYDFPLYIDNKAIMYVIGTEMDYIKEEFGERFTFNNPNQTSECGCGESFHV